MLRARTRSENHNALVRQKYLTLPLVAATYDTLSCLGKGGQEVGKTIQDSAAGL